MKKYLLFVGITLYYATAFAQNWQSKIDEALKTEAQSGSQIEFLILLKAQADVSQAALLKTKTEKAQYVFQQLKATAQKTQQRVIATLEANNADYNALYIVNLIRTKGDLSLIQQIASLPEVAKIAPNPTVHFNFPEEEANAIELRNTVEWGIARIKADSAWAMGIEGKGVVVGGQDTGYDWQHPSLAQKYRGYNEGLFNHNYNWHDAIKTPIEMGENPCGLDTKAPCDDNRHGTHTMGTMVGQDKFNNIGVAPQAQWIGCRNMDRGAGTPFTYLECFEWFLAPTDLNNNNPRPDQAPHVIANSWGCPPSEGCNETNFDILRIAVDHLKASGVVVVVSAGNTGRSGCGSIKDPAAIYENSFTVGASNMEDTIASFSSIGPVLVDGSGRLKPDVVAPGVNIRSAVLNGGYQTFSGTSMSGPHVAGAVALIIAASPELAGQVEVIENILEQTAISIQTALNCGNVSGQAIPNNVYGYGRIDALAAVRAAQQLSNVKNVSLTAWISIYPNPFEDKLILQNTKSIDSELLLFDVQGRLILQQRWNSSSLEINTQHLASGCYFYHIKSDFGVQSGKLVK
jgi:subtilisin family serine protease